MSDSLLEYASRPDESAGSTDARGAALAALRRYLATAARFRQAAADTFGVGVTDVLAMIQLTSDEAISPRQLATRLDLTPSSVTALLDRLEAAGLVRRVPHASDRRKTTVRVSAKGTKMLDQLRDWMRASLGVVDEPDLVVLTRALTAIADALDAQVEAL